MCCISSHECLLGWTDNPVTTVQQRPESIPRIYESFENDDNADKILVFESQLARHHERAMLFLATTKLNSSRPRLVNLTVGRYEEQVQPRACSCSGSWPAPRGALIEPRHDTETVDTWWRQL